MESTAILASPHPSVVDGLRSAEARATTQVLGIVGFAFLTALGAQFQVYVWEVPFTLQTLAVYGSGLFLGWRNGLLAQALYLLVGLFLPVYAGGESGPAILFYGMTAGYLFGFPLSAAVAGLVSKKWNGLLGSVLSLMAASVTLFACGVTWLHFAADHVTWFESIDKGWLRFIPVDFAKVLLVGLLYSGTRHFSRKKTEH